MQVIGRFWNRECKGLPIGNKRIEKELQKSSDFFAGNFAEGYFV
jgi:hypothetical protein